MIQQNIDQLAALCLAFKAVTFAPGKASTYENLLSWAKQNNKGTFVKTLSDYAEQLDDLEADYNRMCIGPYRLTVPPYESVWFGTRVLNTRRTEVVRWFYAQFGLVSNDKEFNEPADYFGYELEFLGYLAVLIQELSRKGDSDRTAEAIDWLNAFWAEHLGHWYDKYLQAIATDSAVEIIRSWAILLQTELSRLFRDVPLKSMTTGLEEEKVAPPKSMKKDDPS